MRSATSRIEREELDDDVHIQPSTEAGGLSPRGARRLAAEAFASALRPEIFGYFRRRSGSAEAAEEMAQEAILRFVEGDYDSASEEARPILFGIARHILADDLRRRRRESDLGMTSFDEMRIDMIPSTAPTPERILAAKHELSEATAIIQAMPPKVRTAFLLSRLHGLKHAQIAAHLGVSKSMVEKYIMDATARLLRGAGASLR